MAKISKGQLGQASGQLGQALDAVKQLQGLDNVVQLIQSSYDELKAIAPLVDALVDDVQAMSDRLDRQQEAMLWMLAAVMAPDPPTESFCTNLVGRVTRDISSPTTERVDTLRAMYLQRLEENVPK